MGPVTKLAKAIAQGLARETNHHRVQALFALGFLTYRCTSRCRTCTIWKRNDEGTCLELSRDEWLSILTQLKYYGIRTFEVFGGDALLRDDAVFDVINFCTQHGIETFFPTNSILCDRQTVHRLVEAGLGTIYVSLDDIGKNNDGIRGIDGAFDRVRETLEFFVEERGCRPNPKIIVCTTLSNLNYNNFGRIVGFLENYPIDAVYPRHLGEFAPENVHRSSIDGLEPEPYFTTSDGQSHLLTKEQYKELVKIFSSLKLRDKKSFINFRGHYLTGEMTYTQGLFPVKPCHVATLLVTINPNGDVVPCPYFRSYVIGNLIRQELGDIWGNEPHRRFLQLQQGGQLPICRNCNTRIDYPTLSEQTKYYAQRILEKSGLKAP